MIGCLSSFHFIIDSISELSIFIAFPLAASRQRIPFFKAELIQGDVFEKEHEGQRRAKILFSS